MARPFWKPDLGEGLTSAFERDDGVRRVARAFAAFFVVIVIGTVGYAILDFTWLDAAYQTVTTITTVGFRELHPLSEVGKVFTIVLILAGVGTALYALTTVIETLFEGRLEALLGRRRMERNIARIDDHVVICGWGRVGKSISQSMAAQGINVVVVDQDVQRARGCPHPIVTADATDDAVLQSAGIDRARSLVAALDTDADNLFVTMSARAMRPDMFIVSRVRLDSNEDKLFRAGANRVVNPQSIGGSRMAAFVLQPNVAEFLDVVMHDGDLEFRLEEVEVSVRSPLVGTSLADAHIRAKSGALVLALRGPQGTFNTNPAPDTVIIAGEVLIAIGTTDQLAALAQVAG